MQRVCGRAQASTDLTAYHSKPETFVNTHAMTEAQKPPVLAKRPTQVNANARSRALRARRIARKLRAHAAQVEADKETTQ